ncbi:hypothetical protein ZWY2020_016958 [Hordeum vulgare]|nr:hypothetical protein ZWY2020_016958 [Hordeum vulgare]
MLAGGGGRLSPAAAVLAGEEGGRLHLAVVERIHAEELSPSPLVSPRRTRSAMSTSIPSREKMLPCLDPLRPSRVGRPTGRGTDVGGLRDQRLVRRSLSRRRPRKKLLRGRLPSLQRRGDSDDVWAGFTFDGFLRLVTVSRGPARPRQELFLRLSAGPCCSKTASWSRGTLIYYADDRYVSFARDEDKWVIYGFETVEREDTWEHLLEHFKDCKLQPEVIFFEVIK